MAMIKVESVHKSYENLNVLKNINLEIQESEVVSIVGPSGAGKSTLLHIIGTLDKPDKGTVYINNVKTFDLNLKKLAQFRSKNIGFVFQHHHLLPEFTALENVAIPGFISKMSRNQAFKRSKELLGFLGLSERLEHKPSELSGGELQRVSVARALMNQPMVVLADEPSGNLDTANAEELHKLFFTLRDEFKQTFIIVTHNTKLAEMSDRTINMQDGEIVL